MIDDATPGQTTPITPASTRGSRWSRMLAALSILATIASLTAAHVSDSILELSTVERAGLSSPFAALAVVLALVSLCLDATTITWCALALAIFLARGGTPLEYRSDWAAQADCSERLAAIVSRLRHYKLIDDGKFTTPYQGDLTRIPYSGTPDWPQSCGGSTVYVLDRLNAKGDRLTGLVCSHRVMATLDGRAMVLPTLPWRSDDNSTIAQ